MTAVSWRCRFIKVANETMCRPIRSLTEAKGHALAKHVYVLPILFYFIFLRTSLQSILYLSFSPLRWLTLFTRSLAFCHSLPGSILILILPLVHAGLRALVELEDSMRLRLHDCLGSARSSFIDIVPFSPPMDSPSPIGPSRLPYSFLFVLATIIFADLSIYITYFCAEHMKSRNLRQKSTHLPPSLN